MAYTPYRTATLWQAYYASLNNVGLSDEQKVRIDILGALEDMSGTVGDTFSAMFTASAGVYSYTAATATQLSNLVGKTLIACFISGGTLQVSSITWNDTTMTFDSNAITFNGGEIVVVLGQ